MRLWKCVSMVSRDRRGVSAIEFAMIAPIMAILMLGAYDLGNAVQQQIQLQEGVRAGGAYAINRPTDVNGIQNAVAGAIPGLTLANTNTPGKADVVCSCLNPNTGTVASLAACTAPNFATCTGQSNAKQVTITAIMNYTALEPWVSAAIPNITATYVTRFQ